MQAVTARVGCEPADTRGCPGPWIHRGGLPGRHEGGQGQAQPHHPPDNAVACRARGSAETFIQETCCFKVRLSLFEKKILTIFLKLRLELI